MKKYTITITDERLEWAKSNIPEEHKQTEFFEWMKDLVQEEISRKHSAWRAVAQMLSVGDSAEMAGVRVTRDK